MMPRVLHVLFGYYPDPIGGTEVYVEALSRHQKNTGMQVAIAAPAETDANYRHKDIEVFRFALNAVSDLDDLYGEGDLRGAETLEKIARDFQADIVHFHAFTRGVSLLAAKKIRAGGAALVITYHTPTVSCSRGTMMRWGETPCSGSVKTEPCVACSLQGKGMPSAMAKVVATIPRVASNGARHLPGSSVTTALRMPALMQLRQKALLELLQLADHWVGVCDWVCQVLRKNGIDGEKLSLSRQGVAGRLPEEIRRRRIAGKPLRAVMLGRVDPAKGWHIVLDALASRPDLEINIDAYAVNQVSDSSYARTLNQAAAGEPRFNWCPPLPGEQMLERLQDYDFLLVPSQWLETGPLVVLEAFEAGIPVIGSALGGIAELVQHENTGYLVSPYNAIDAWTHALEMVVNDRARLDDWHGNIVRPRGMLESAQDMIEVYRLAIDRRKRSSSA